MWDRRCRLSIGTKGGKALRGLDLRAFRHGPAAAFFKGAVMTLRVAEGDEKYKRRLFFDGARLPSLKASQAPSSQAQPHPPHRRT